MSPKPHRLEADSEQEQQQQKPVSECRVAAGQLDFLLLPPTLWKAPLLVQFDLCDNNTRPAQTDTEHVRGSTSR